LGGYKSRWTRRDVGAGETQGHEGGNTPQGKNGQVKQRGKNMMVGDQLNDVRLYPPLP